MCLAVLGKVKEIQADQVAIVEYGGIPLKVDLGLVNAKVGDTVLIHAGCAISVLDEIELVRWQEIMSDLAELSGQDLQVTP